MYIAPTGPRTALKCVPVDDGVGVVVATHSRHHYMCCVPTCA